MFWPLLRVEQNSLVLKDSPHIQKLSGTNVFPRSRHQYIFQLSKNPALSCVSNHSLFRNHSLQLSTTRCIQLQSLFVTTRYNQQPFVTISNHSLFATTRCSQPLVAISRFKKCICELYFVSSNSLCFSLFSKSPGDTRD